MVALRSPARIAPCYNPQVQVLSVMNQMGGVGKTTTTINLAYALAREGNRVLMIDLDPQANTTLSLPIKLDPQSQAHQTVYGLLMGGVPLEQCLHPIEENLMLLPSITQQMLAPRPDRSALLSNALKASTEKFDYVVIDCPPAIDVLTANALMVSQGIIIPVSMSYLALMGLRQIWDTVRSVQKVNPELKVNGILFTFVDFRHGMTPRVMETVKKYFGDLVYETHIRQSVKLNESQQFKQSIFDYARNSPAAKNYEALAQEVRSRAQTQPA